MKRSFVACLLLAILYLPVCASTFYIPAGSSQQAVERVLDKMVTRDTLLIQPGVHTIGTIRIQKAIYVAGAPGAVLDGQGKASELLIIEHDSVVVEDLHFRGTGMSHLSEIAAIRVRDARYIRLHNLHIEDCAFGVYLENVRGAVIKGCTMRGSIKTEAQAGNAIHAWKCRFIRLDENELRHFRDGIYLEFVEDSKIISNISVDNLRYGLHFMFSHRNTYRANEFSNNGAGVAVMFSRKISMTNNTFSDHHGGASYGLLLKEITDGAIDSNRFVNNTIGLYAEGTSRIYICNNYISGNGRALDIKGNCLETRIEGNDFIANTYEVVSNSQHNLNQFHGNYWSQYRGYDLDKDGIGDIEYRPVSLFSRVTAEIPSAAILERSLFAETLVALERAFPTLIPSELTDPMPAMQPLIP